MKKILGFVVLLSAVVSKADVINLPAGGSLQIGNNTVSCPGSSLNICSVENNNGYIRVTLGGKFLLSVESLDEAATKIAKLRIQGLCQ